jgi:hypothetical protein
MDVYEILAWSSVWLLVRLLSGTLHQMFNAITGVILELNTGRHNWKLLLMFIWVIIERKTVKVDILCVVNRLFLYPKDIMEGYEQAYIKYMAWDAKVRLNVKSKGV